MDAARKLNQNLTPIFNQKHVSLFKPQLNVYLLILNGHEYSIKRLNYIHRSDVGVENSVTHGNFPDKQKIPSFKKYK